MDTYEGDPSSPLSLHKYAYAVSDPVIWLDPSGNTPLSDFTSQLNVNCVRMGISVLWTVMKLGQMAHTAIALDVANKYPALDVRWNVYTSPGFADLVVANGLYEIKPWGGTVSALPQLARYLSSGIAQAEHWYPGNIPFDDYVNFSSIPGGALPYQVLPNFVSLHYELTVPGVIEYDYQFNTLLLVTAFALSTLPKMEQTVIGTNEAQMDEIQIGVALPVS